MINKFTSIDRVIHGVQQDFPFTNDINVVECIEWIGNCLDLIEVPYQYINKVTDGNIELGHPCSIPIKKYRGELPKDLHNIVQIREVKTGLPLIYSTDSFHINLQKSEENIPATPLSLVNGTFKVRDAEGNLVDNALTSNLLETQNKLKDPIQDSLTYKINGCFIFTNFEEGELYMSYTAFPTDCNGYPLIPDNIKYIEACKYFIAEKIGQKLYLSDKLSKDKFEYLQQQRNWYVGAATTSGLMPSIDKLESWKNMTLRLIPNIDFHATGFKYSSDPHKQYTHNSI